MPGKPGNQRLQDGGSHSLRLTATVSWMLPGLQSLALAHVEHTIRHVLTRSRSLQPLRIPMFVLARVATGCVTDRCCHTSCILPCHAPILHCAVLALSRLAGSRQPVALAHSIRSAHSVYRRAASDCPQ